MFNHDFASLLALSKKERAVLEILNEDPLLKVASISRDTKISRMTLYPILQSLKNRRLVEYKRVGKRKFWTLTNKQLISDILWDCIQNFDERKNIQIRSGDSGFSIIRGTKNLINIWERAVDIYKENRIYGIQPTASLVSILSKVNWQEIMSPINNAILKKGLIVEGLTREDYINTYINHFKGDKDFQVKILKSLLGRKTDMALVSNEYLNYPVDFMMFENKGFIINWKDEVAIEIDNTDMLGFLKELFDLARGYGKHVDQNAYVSKLLTEKISNSVSS
jgi:hypothetical protein